MRDIIRNNDEYIIWSWVLDGPDGVLVRLNFCEGKWTSDSGVVIGGGGDDWAGRKFGRVIRRTRFINLNGEIVG